MGQISSDVEGRRRQQVEGLFGKFSKGRVPLLLHADGRKGLPPSQAGAMRTALGEVAMHPLIHLQKSLVSEEQGRELGQRGRPAQGVMVGRKAGLGAGAGRKAG